MKAENKLVGVGLLTAISASLCCIAPVIVLVAGTSGLASTFSWLEPVRPYFIGFTVLILAFAWYQKLKSKKQGECNCDTNEKPKFNQRKTFLGIVTAFAIIMVGFPSYSEIFFPKTEKQIIIVSKINIETAEFKINGMTCSACEHHVKTEINKLKGIVEATVSYEKANAIITFDNSKKTSSDIENALNLTGYKVTRKKVK